MGYVVIILHCVFLFSAEKYQFKFTGIDDVSKPKCMGFYSGRLAQYLMGILYKPYIVVKCLYASGISPHVLCKELDKKSYTILTIYYSGIICGFALILPCIFHGVAITANCVSLDSRT